MPQSFVTEQMMLAFRDELHKLASVGDALKRVGGEVARFGQRQLHGLSGWKPKGGLAAMELGSHAQNINPAAKAALQKAEEWGMTNLPGTLKAVREHGLAPVVGRGMAAQWHGQGPVMKTLTVGLPAAGMAGAALAKPQEGGPSREERMGKEVGSLVGGIAGSPVPIVGNIALGVAGEQAGKYIGRGVHKVRSMLHPGVGLHPHGVFPRQSTDLTQESGQAAPSETIMSDRASSGAGGGFG